MIFRDWKPCFQGGAVAGGLLIPYIIQRINKSLTTGTVWGMMALAFGILAKTENLLVAEFLYFFVGFGLASWAVVLSSAQEQTPIEHQGRLVSLSNGTGGLVVLLLYILLYSFGEFIPVQNLYYIEAGFCLLLIFLLVLNPLDESSPSATMIHPSGHSVRQE